jgi:hypothetical protein
MAAKENHKALAQDMAELKMLVEEQQRQINAKSVSFLTQFQKVLPPADLVARTGNVCYECSGYCCTLFLVVTVGALAIAGGVLGVNAFWAFWAIASRFIPGFK